MHLFRILVQILWILVSDIPCFTTFSLALCNSLRLHPQLRTFPVVSAFVSFSTIFPHTHWHFQTLRPSFVLRLTGLSTVRNPNCCPVRSLICLTSFKISTESAECAAAPLRTGYDCRQSADQCILREPSAPRCGSERCGASCYRILHRPPRSRPAFSP